MDITKFIVSARSDALLYGDYSTYHHQLARKLQNYRKKLNLATKARGKFSPKVDVVAEQIGQNHDYLHLLLYTAERAWAHAMRLKAAHSTDTKGMDGRARSHIVSRLVKAAKSAEKTVKLLSQSAASMASHIDQLEARAYASMLRGAAQFENRSWELCLRSYSVTRIIYSALAVAQKSDIYKDLLSEAIDPSIRYAAYQLKIPRTLAIAMTSKSAFPKDDIWLVDQIDQLDPTLLGEAEPGSQTDQALTSGAPQTINWRDREVKIEDAAIAIALASSEIARQRLTERLETPGSLPKDVAAAYDDVLIASQDAADATKHAIDELREEGVAQNDSRVQSLQVTRTAVNYQMISWRIGRNRVLTGSHDGALLDPAPNPKSIGRAKKGVPAHSQSQEKPEPLARRISRLKEKVVLYDATLQSLDSIKDLPGVAADGQLTEQLDATYDYFQALKCLIIARSHSLADNSLNALTLTKHAFDKCQSAADYFSKQGSTPPTGFPLNMDIYRSDVDFLWNLLRGEVQRCRALVEVDNWYTKSTSSIAAPTMPLVQRLSDYPLEGADLTNLVVYPPKIEMIPVKPLFFDVAWNYIDYPGKTGAMPGPVEEKKGWFGFGR